MPHLLGSERTGPDLSQEGGEHPYDWHLAHFTNPPFTRPRSLMPRFAFEGRADVDALTAYVQSLGGTSADARVGNPEPLIRSHRGVPQRTRRQHRMAPFAGSAGLAGNADGELR